jgi:hypothetical protein
VGFEPAEIFQELEVLDFAPEIGEATYGVVVGERDRIQATFFGTPKNVENGDTRLLVVGRRRSVDVEVDAAPRQGCG